MAGNGFDGGFSFKYFTMLFIGQLEGLTSRHSHVSPCFNFGQGIAHVVDTADTFQIQLDPFTRLEIEQTRCTASGERARIHI